MNRYSKSKHRDLYVKLRAMAKYSTIIEPLQSLKGARAAVIADKASYVTGMTFRTHTVADGALFVRID